MSRATTEYCTLIKATGQLTRAVRDDLVQLSVELVASQLITVDKGEELRNRNVDVMERAAKLVALVTNKVEQDEQNYYTFVRILMGYRATYGKVLEVLEPVYSTGGHIYNKGAYAVRAIDEPWFHGQLLRENAEKRLKVTDQDSFLVRESTTQTGKLILSVKNKSSFYHFFIERGVGSYEVEGTNLPFSSLVELIDYYKKYDLPESDTGEVIRINSPCDLTATRIYDSQAQASPPSVTINCQKQRCAADEDYSYVMVPHTTPGISTPEPLALLHQQRYFHGAISRIQAEALLKKDGQFLVRESQHVGEYVLSGMAHGRPCHFLLLDGDGKVIFRDKNRRQESEFKSIVELVEYITTAKTTLVNGDAEVALREPVNVRTLQTQFSHS